MKVELEKFESGWIGISIELKPEAIDDLIDRLETLKSGKIGHFHFRRDRFEEAVGGGDIEISMAPQNSEIVDNMIIE